MFIYIYTVRTPTLNIYLSGLKFMIAEKDHSRSRCERLLLNYPAMFKLQVVCSWDLETKQSRTWAERGETYLMMRRP